jgi:hypothetical protein
MANQLKLQLQPNVVAHYYFSDVKLPQIVQNLAKGYKFLGVCKQISANDFLGFANYRYTKLLVTIDWRDKDKNYNQSTNVFMLVMAK